MEDVMISRLLLNFLVLALFFLLAIIGFLVYSILKYRKSSQALVKANDTIIDSQRELEAYAKDLKTSQKALNSKSDALKQQEEKKLSNLWTMTK